MSEASNCTSYSAANTPQEDTNSLLAIQVSLQTIQAMRLDAQPLGTILRLLILLRLPLVLCLPRTRAITIQKRITAADPGSAPYPNDKASALLSVSSGSGGQIPVSGRCGLISNKSCAGESQYICKNQWWLSCWIPSSGSCTPSRETWQCNGPMIEATNPN